VTIASAPEFSALALPHDPPLIGRGRPGCTIVLLGLVDPSLAGAALMSCTSPLDRIVAVSERPGPEFDHPDLLWTIDLVRANPNRPDTWIDQLAIQTEIVVVLSAATIPAGPWIDALLDGLVADVAAVQPAGIRGDLDQVLDFGFDPQERAAGLQARAWFLAGQQLPSRPAVTLGDTAFAVRADTLRSLSQVTDLAALRVAIADLGAVRTVDRSLLVGFDADLDSDDPFDFEELGRRAARHASYLVNRWLLPGTALVLGSAALSEELTSLGWAVVHGTAAPVPDQLDALDPRPSLVVADSLDYDQLAWCDVATVVVPTNVAQVVAALEAGHPAPDALSDLDGLAATLDQLDHDESFGTLLQRCRTALDLEDVATAIESLAHAHALRPAQPQALNAMAVCAAAMGNIQEAVELIDAVLESAPTFTAARENAAALGLLASP
jgi:hypothetical protein